MSEDRINARNFHEEMIEFNKVKPKAFVMIRHEYKVSSEKVRGDAAKDLWWRYLSDKGFHRALEVFEGQLRNRIPVMVCCDDPAIFDLQWSRTRHRTSGPDFDEMREILR